MKLFLVSLIVILSTLSAVSASQLPTVNGDSDNWGTVLNDFLSRIAGNNGTELNLTMVNGTNIYPNAINTTQIKDGTITAEDLGTDSVADNQLDYSNVTLSDFTNDANYLDKDTGGTINGSLIINGNLSLIGSYLNATIINQYLNGSFFPSITNFFNIGSSDFRWNNIFSNNIDLSGNLNASSISANDWTNVSITESQISDLQTYLTSYTETDPFAYNGTLAYNSSLGNYYLNSNPNSYYNSTTLPPSSSGNPFDQVLNTTSNVTFYDINSTGDLTSSTGFFSSLGSILNRITNLFVADINASGNIKASGNLTAFNLFGNLNWSYIKNSPNFAFNSSLSNYYLLSNPNSYYNSTTLTLLSQLTDDLGNRGYTNNLNFTNGAGYLTSYTETDPFAYNGTLAYNSSLGNYYLLSNPNSYYNSSTLPSSGITGSGTSGYLSIWNGTASLNNSVIYQNGSNVGIGTTSPSATLDVNGSINGEMYYDAIVDASGKGKYLTVHEATAGESEGASIFIRNGNYTESASIVLKNGQKLVGESREGVIIDLNGGYQLIAQGTSGTHFTGILLDSFSITGATTYGIHQIYFLYTDKSTIRNVKSYWLTNSGRPHGIYLYYSDYNLLDNVIVENGHSNFFLKYSNYNKIISSSSFTAQFENYNIQSSAYNTFVGDLAKGSGVGVYMRYTSDNNNFISMTFDGVSNAIALYNSPSTTLFSGIIAKGITGVPIFEGLGTATNLFLENSYLEGSVTIYGDNFHIANTIITGDVIINGSADGTSIANSQFNSITNNGTNTKLINNKASGLTNYISDIGNIGVNTTSPSNALNIVGATNSTGGFIVGGNVGITGNYTNGNCWTSYSGGIVYATNCSVA